MMPATTSVRRRFVLAPSLLGWEVVDARSGRPLDRKQIKREAAEKAEALNEAAAAAPYLIDHELSQPGALYH